MKTRNAILTCAYFACSIPMYYFYTGSIPAGGFNFLYCYLAAIAFIVITFAYFLVVPDVERMSKVLKYAGIMSVPYILTMIYSLFVWTMNLTPLRIMIRGFFWPTYQLIAIFMAASAVYCFGKKGLYYQLAALFTAYVLFFIGLIQEGGVAQLCSEYWRLLVTASEETGPLLAQLEKIAYAHGMGIFLIYLVFTWKENRENKWFFIPALFFFSAGLKRSALLGMAVGFVVAMVTRWLSQRGKRSFAYVSGVIMLIVGLVYIWGLSVNIVDLVTERFHINTMGRSEIYSVMRNYYDFSVTFWGKGLGYVSYSISTGLIDVGNQFRGDIHNDMLRQYIELGMFGFVMWLWSFFYWRIKRFMEGVDVRQGTLVLIVFVYCFICYMTENMYYRFNTGLALAVVILSYAVQREEQKEKNSYE